MKDQLINLVTLGFAKGYRTFLCVSVIIALALAQKYLGLQIDQPTWLILLGILAACLRSAIGNAAALLLLCTLLALPVAADTNAPAFYAVQAASLEAHHGDTLRSSGVGAITHLGVDYGDWAIEGLVETPLYKTEEHTRRSIGADILLKPWTFGNIEPYLVGGAGYYWGSDPYQCLAADIGAGVRFHVSDHLFLQLDARDAIPYDGRTLVVPARFQIVSVGVGGSF